MSNPNKKVAKKLKTFDELKAERRKKVAKKKAATKARFVKNEGGVPKQNRKRLGKLLDIAGVKDTEERDDIMAAVMAVPVVPKVLPKTVIEIQKRQLDGNKKVQAKKIAKADKRKAGLDRKAKKVSWMASRKKKMAKIKADAMATPEWKAQAKKVGSLLASN